MRVAVRDHQNKSRGLVKAIAESDRLELAQVGEPADILLIDHDVTVYYRNTIRAYKNYGARVFLYPHGATAHLAWDGVWPEYELTDCYLAMSEGQAEVMRVYGYHKQVEVTGWHWCEQKPFSKFAGGKPTVLYAPIHVLGNGFIHQPIKEINALVMERLCKMSVNLKVRHIGELEACGIEKVGGVEYVQGATNNSVNDIDKADYVVSFGTFAYLSVSRGKPTIMYRQDIPYFDGHSEDGIIEAESWELYEDYMRYPIDVMDEDVLIKANQEQTEWRNKFIGEQMTTERLEEVLLA